MARDLKSEEALEQHKRVTPHRHKSIQSLFTAMEIQVTESADETTYDEPIKLLIRRLTYANVETYSSSCPSFRSCE